MRSRLEIGIVGAGPAGLASALYLHRQGHHVVVFERFAKAQPVGSGLMIQPTGQAVLDDLGLMPALAALAQPVNRLDGRDARTGRIVLDVRYSALRGSQHAYGVHRSALFDVLHDAVVRAGIEVRVESTARTFEAAGGKGQLRVAGQSQAWPFDLVVDCCGAGSPLRHHSLAQGSERSLRFGAVWATVPWPDTGFDAHALMQRYRRADVMIGVLPIGRQRADGPQLAAFFWSLPVATWEGLQAGGFAAWAARVAGLWPETTPLLAALGGFEALTLARYVHATMRIPYGERIVFVGDSAHSTSPQLGQGANMALLDAKALAHAIDSSPDLPSALARYAALRRWHVRLYQALSLSLTPFYQSGSRSLPVLRDLLVAHVARVPPAPRLLAAMVAGNLLGAVKALEL